MGLFSAVAQYLGGKKAMKYSGYQPYSKYVKEYEGGQHTDIAGLYGNVGGRRAYEDPNFGYSPAELEGMYGQGRDVLSGEAAAERQNLEDRFRSPGGFGLQSAQYARGLQRSDLARVQRANQIRENMIVRNAAQKRADAMARLAAVTGAYQFGVGATNAYQAAKRKSLMDAYAGAGGVADTVASMAYGGWSGGGGGAASGGGWV